MTQPDYIYIQNNAQLHQIGSQLAQAAAVAIDTEFTREKTYYPQLGLIQIASESLVACIDPLSISDFSPLIAILQQASTIKILHAARQDLEVLWQTLKITPTPLFDTQLAACFLGLHEQISYAALVQHFLNISLPKAHTRTDWSKRPLSTEQLQYAADDVRYLYAMYPHVRAQLESQARWDWCMTEGSLLAKNATQVSLAEDLWQHVTGVQRLTPPQLAILRELSQWREQQAQHSNRPRRWILQDEVMLALATQAPANLEQLRVIPALPAGVVDRHADTLLRLIEQGRQVPAALWPAPPIRDALSPEQKTLLTTLSTKLRQIAEQQHICTPVLATRRDLERLVVNGQRIPLLEGWRHQLAGQFLMPLLPSILAS